MTKGDQLILEMRSNPEELSRNGVPYKLLLEYFNGYAPNTLKKLLSDSDINIVRSAAWISSELGHRACNLMNSVVPLLSLKDRFVSWHILDVISVCATGSKAREFWHVAYTMESDDHVLADQAAKLICRASKEQIEAARTKFQIDSAHYRGLGMLLSNHPERVKLMYDLLNDSDVIARKYGALALENHKRLGIKGTRQ